jgi:uncharacterized protein YhaN
LIESQVVPMPLFSWLLGVFVLGFVALGVWWMMPGATLGKYGGWIAAIGVGGSVVALLFKYLVESSAANRFDACHKQIEMVLDQIDEAEEEQAQLDRELPLTEGSVAMRLQHAERHLAELERILPVESRRREAVEEINAAERRAKLAEEKYAAALANWKAKLRALGLPDDINPASLATMAGQCERLAELEDKVANRRDDLTRRQRDFVVISQRIAALAEETGVTVAGLVEGGNKSRQGKPGPATPSTGKVTPLEQLDQLRAEYHKHQQQVEQRNSLRERAKALKTDQAKHARAAIGYRRRREALFQKCGVANEDELRQLAGKLEEAEELRKKHAAITREIAAAIGKHGGEPDFAPLLAPDAIGRLEPDWETLSAQVEELDRDLKDALQRRGAMVEQQRALAADHSLATKQIELDVVEQQIARARDAWRERATVSLLLERVRQDYEAHRQPDTLKEASEYLSKLTGGKYTRIWTPLAHDILFVDTTAGEALSVQVLSRGTREQLFVSLRLALVSAFARRGIHLPMILDDVFVNFDAARTRIACAVLRDFAKQGHQLFVFTCHEHVWNLFKELKADTRRIPNRFGEVEEASPGPQPEPLAIEPEPVAVEPEPDVLPPPRPVEKTPRPQPPAIESPVATANEREADDEEPEVEETEVITELVPSREAPISEVEFWWDAAPTDSNGDARQHDDSSSDWLPEPVIHPQRW